MGIFPACSGPALNVCAGKKNAVHSGECTALTLP